MSKILFITATRIGDAVLSTGLLAHLLAQHPGAQITVACGAAPARLFAGVPGLDRILVMKKRPRAGHWRDLWRATIGTRWTHVVDLRSSTIAHLLAAEQRSIFHGASTPMHKVRQYGALFRLDPPPSPALWATPDAEAKAIAALPDGPPVLALAPAANWRGKEWPLDRFVELTRRLTAPGERLANARIAVFCAPQERESLAPLLAALPADRLVDVAGRLDLLTLYAALKRCRMFIGNDSGLMHMAACAGVPTLGLFGPSDDRIYGPWGDRTAFVRTPESLAELTAAPDYDHRTTGTLMHSLTVAAVETAAQILYTRCYD
jgi:ADP-heptose:LPS heptosyltransferase